jgi:hypothetical protein
MKHEQHDLDFWAEFEKTGNIGYYLEYKRENRGNREL